MVTFLGIQIDTARLELRLPLDKLACLRRIVVNWLGRRSGHRSDLESLLGHLSHAAVVVKPGRIFAAAVFPDGEGQRKALFCASGFGS